MSLLPGIVYAVYFKLGLALKIHPKGLIIYIMKDTYEKYKRSTLEDTLQQQGEV